MNISQIQLRNFSSHQATEIALEKPISIFVGALNAGKSSIQQAIEVALCGQCEYYRKKTDSILDLVHDLDGADKFDIALTIEGQKLKRGRSREAGYLKWADAEGSAAEVQAVLMASLRTRPAVVSALLNTTDFFMLEPSEQREIVLNLIGAEVNEKVIREAFTGEPEALRLLSGTIDSVRDIDNAYDAAYKMRTDVNRQLKDLKPMEPRDGDPPPVDDIKARLKGIHGERDKIITAIATARVAGDNNSSALRASLSKKITDIDAWMSANPRATKADAERLNSEILRTNKMSEDATKEKRDLEGKLVNARAEVLVVERNIKLLFSFNGTCVAGTHRCPASPADMSKAMEEEKKRLAGFTDAVVSLERQIAEVAPRCDMRQKLQRIQEEMEKHRRIADSWTEKDRQRKELVSELEKVPANNPAADDERQKRVADLNEQLGVLDGRIKAGNEKLESASEWIAYNKQVVEVAERRRQLEIRKRHLESLVEFFGPKGVKVSLIEKKVQSFEQLINGALANFGFEFRFRPDPWAITAKGRPVTRLSRSERMRLGIAFQIGIAKITGLNFVLIDNAEILTPDVKKAMVGMLLEAQLDQVILMWSLMTSEEEFLKQKPNHLSIEFFIVRNKDGVSEVQSV